MVQVLLVDDNSVQAATRKAVLGRIVPQIAVVTSAREALEIVAEQETAETLELVITDHWMPGMNGTEFVRSLRKKFPELPVLVLSGQSDVEQEYQGLEVVFRMKPIAPEELIRLTRELTQSSHQVSLVGCQ